MWCFVRTRAAVSSRLIRSSKCEPSIRDAIWLKQWTGQREHLYSSTARTAKSWSQADKDELQRLLREGWSEADCAKKLQITEHAIRMIIHYNGAPENAKNWNDADTLKLISLREGAKPWHDIKTHDFPNHTIDLLKIRVREFDSKKGAARQNVNWRTSELETLIDLYNANLPQKDIAKQMGRSLQSIKTIVKRLLKGEIGNGCSEILAARGKHTIP